MITGNGQSSCRQFEIFFTLLVDNHFGISGSVLTFKPTLWNISALSFIYIFWMITGIFFSTEQLQIFWNLFHFFVDKFQCYLSGSFWLDNAAPSSRQYGILFTWKKLKTFGGQYFSMICNIALYWLKLWFFPSKKHMTDSYFGPNLTLSYFF